MAKLYYVLNHDSNPSNLPDPLAAGTTTVDSPATTTIGLTNVQEGLWYLHVSFKHTNTNTYPIGTYKIQIDTENPTAPIIHTVNPSVTSVWLEWTASIDVSPVVYQIYWVYSGSSNLLQTTTDPFEAVGGLPSSNVFTLFVRAVDSTGKHTDSLTVTFATDQVPWSAPPPGYCFVGGTKVSTPNGEANIENIAQGDRILSYNERTGEIETDTVIYTSNHTVDSYLKINGLEVTGNHPIYTQNLIKNAENITIGDTLIGIDGDVPVLSREVIEKTAVVYNLEVENNHNYFAGGVLVHNKVWPPSCPYVWVWNGTNYEPDNSLLTNSEDFSKQSSMIDDAYVLQKSPVPVGDKYKFRIMEGELFEISYIDNAELITIDHDGDFNVGVTPEGYIVIYGDPVPPLSCLDKNNANLTNVVGAMGDEYYDGYKDDCLVVKFACDYGKPAKLILRSDLKCTYDYLPWDAIEPLYGPIEIRILNADGDWIQVGSIIPRELWSIDVFDLTSFLQASTDYLHVNISWRAHHQVDFVGLDQSEGGDFIDTTCVLTSAVHSVDGDVMDELAYGDETYVELNCGEYVDLEFPYEAPETEYRDIILYTKGYYTIIQRYVKIDDIEIIQQIDATATVSGAENNAVEIYFIATQGNASKIIGDVTLSGGEPESKSLTLRNPVGYGMLMVLRYENSGTGANTVDVTIESGTRSRTMHFDFNAADGLIQERIVDLDATIKEFYENSTTVYCAPHISREGLIQPETLIWDFGNGTVITQHDTGLHEFPFTESGSYTVNLTIVFENGLTTSLTRVVEIPNRPPVQQIGVYQEVFVSVKIAGRKGNTVTVEIYEDGELIRQMSVTRGTGAPDTQTMVLNKYLGRSYSVILKYSANHPGENPTWLKFTSGDDTLSFFKEFNTLCGYYQEITLSTSYLDGVALNNYQFFFDASESYDRDGAIASYVWDFGDGTAAEGAIVAHTFAGPSTYTVTLTITDNGGAMARETIDIEIGSG
ncbi:MAG: PKD domain-containing protein [Methanobacteriota archaeon]